MKTRTIFQCDFCGKMLLTKSIILKHEKICFYNPESKSCATCKNLKLELFIGNRKLTEKEEDIYNFNVDGTYQYRTDMEDYHYTELFPEFKYLNEAEFLTFCDAKNKVLNKLTTGCYLHCKKQ